MDPAQITSEWLSDVLGASVEITADERIGDGLVGMNVRYSLAVPDGSDLPSSIIAKLPSPDPTSRATGMALRNYEREVKFYNEIAPTVDIRVARCFHGEWHEADGDFVLLLEDLSPCEQGNQITGCSADLARRSVVELARLHGPRWGDPALDDVEFLSRRVPADSQQLQMMWGMFLPGFFATYAKYLDAEGVALIERFGARIPDWVEGRDLPSTVTHGDYRLDNLMFASERGGYPVATVDWQTPGQGPASGDVSYFLGAGPLPEVRREIERDVLAAYLAALEAYDVSVDEAAFWRHYARDVYAGIIMSVVASQIVGSSDRSEAMFAAMATRHTRHALDLDSESLIYVELPDFHIPHAEKIEWMIETHGWAMEPVAARTDTEPPLAPYVYTIGYPEAFGFPEVVVFGLTPSAARGLFDMIADLLRGGTQIPLAVELAGLFDNDLRCVFAPIDAELLPELFATAVAWRHGASFAAVQLLWPDRNGFLPTEPGFDRKLVLAQPVVGDVGDPPEPVHLPVLVYDGDCGFCTASVRFGQRWIADMPTAVVYQGTALDRLGLTDAECSAAVQYVARDHCVHAAEDAVAAVLLGAGPGWWVLGATMHLPGIHWLAGVVYRWVARNRRRLPGATDACAVDLTKR